VQSYLLHSSHVTLLMMKISVVMLKLNLCDISVFLVHLEFFFKFFNVHVCCSFDVSWPAHFLSISPFSGHILPRYVYILTIQCFISLIDGILDLMIILRIRQKSPAWGRGTPFTPFPFTSPSFALFSFCLFSLVLTIFFFCPSLSFLPE